MRLPPALILLFALSAPASYAQDAPAGAMGSGAFDWMPYQFQGTEFFRYEIRSSSGGDVETGSYSLQLEPAGEDRVRMAVEGGLGDQSYSSTITVGTGTQGMQMGFMQFMTLGPIAIGLFNPAAWMMLGGRELTLGDEWSQSAGGESVSMKVERACDYAGQEGLAVVFRANGEVMQESCVSRDVALPLYVRTGESGSEIELTLVEYRP